MRSVLLADDDLEDRILFEDAFRERTDVEILPSVAGGVNVIELLDSIIKDEDLPDLIILDQNMPIMNGKQALRFIRSKVRYSNIIIVVYTTYTDRQLVKDCMELGASHVVDKPITDGGYQRMMDECLLLIDN